MEKETKMVEKLRTALQNIADKAQHAAEQPIVTSHILHEIWGLATAALIFDVIEGEDESVPERTRTSKSPF